MAPLASSLARFIEGDEPALLLGAIAAVIDRGPDAIDEVDSGVLDPVPGAPDTLDGLFPDGGADEMVVALADIGEGFGTAGVTFLRQVGMAPAAVVELAHQVARNLGAR